MISRYHFFKGLRFLALASALFLLGCSERSEGVVTHVDKQAQQISIAHEGVTVVFRVKDPAVLAGVSVRDRVKFVYAPIGRDFTILNVDKTN